MRERAALAIVRSRVLIPKYIIMSYMSFFPIGLRFKYNIFKMSARLSQILTNGRTIIITKYFDRRSSEMDNNGRNTNYGFLILF